MQISRCNKATLVIFGMKVIIFSRKCIFFACCIPSCACVCPCVRRSVQFAAGREQQRCHLQFLEIRPHHSSLPPQRHAAIRQGRVRTQHMCLHKQVCRSLHVCGLIALCNLQFFRTCLSRRRGCCATCWSSRTRGRWCATC